MATDQVFIYTMNRGIQQGAWSRYIFPFTCEHFAHLENTLYIRHLDKVSYVDMDLNDDDGVDYSATIQWPWLDFGSPGVNKMLDSFDIAGNGTASISIGYDQTNFNAFTDAYSITMDNVPGQIIPFPITAPSMSVKLDFIGGTWQWNALQLYLSDNRPRS